MSGEYTPEHLSAFRRYQAHGYTVKELADDELTVLLEDPNFSGEVGKERERRTKALAPPPLPPPPPAAPVVTSTPVTWKGLEKALGPVVEAIVKRIVAVENRPVLKDMGTFNGSVKYAAGEIVTHGGSMYHCNVNDTSERPGTSGSWTLCVKSGRDGRDRRDEER